VARRLWTIAASTIVIASMAAPAAATEPVETGWNPRTEIYEMVFPVDGETDYDDTWGACRSRCRRRHEGTDIMADKLVPVVAVASGTVGWISSDRNRECCSMEIRHDDGWSSWYVHLNNDTPGTDDGRGWGFADGIEAGVRVEAGQLIGWVGDSGNAEITPPHLHFELQDPDDVGVNPYPHLVAAERADLLAVIRAHQSADDGFVDLFVDGDLIERLIEAVLKLQSTEPAGVDAVEPSPIEIS
jgi:hypothetical protein